MVGHFCSTIHFSAVSGNWWNQPSVEMVVWAWMLSCTRWSTYCSIQALSWNRCCFFEIEAFLQLLPNSTIISEYHATETEIMIFQETVWTEPSQLHVRASCVSEIKNLWFNTGIFYHLYTWSALPISTHHRAVNSGAKTVCILVSDPFSVPWACIKKRDHATLYMHRGGVTQHKSYFYFNCILIFTFLYKSNLSELLYYINPN